MATNTSKEEIARRLREARARVFETAADAARAVRMKPVTVRAHESGQNGVSPGDLEDYARTYGVDVGWLLTGEGARLPQVDRHDQLGYFMLVHTTVEDGVWLPIDDEEPDWPTRHTGILPRLEDYVLYNDPRFSGELINALRIATRKTDGAYINGTIAFVIEPFLSGYREGDHVIVLREDLGRQVGEWTLRRVEIRDGEEWFVSLISDDPPFPYSQGSEDGDSGMFTWVLGVVIASQTRRPVPEPTIAAAAQEVGQISKFLRKRPYHDNSIVAHPARS